VFALRNEKGDLGAFQNVCSHQRMGVLENGLGHLASLRCKYHGWTYDLDGRFVSAPPLVAPAPFDPEANGLQRITVESWQGLVFISIAGVKPLADAVAQLSQSPPLDPMAFCGEVTTELGCNWKVYVEYCLEEARFSWDWPALIARFGNGLAEVQQVIPRSFGRTRVVQYFFTVDTLEAARARIALAKSACEDAQRSIEQGALLSSSNPRVQAFRARIRGFMT
jgi:nitrite reductase/ring-hydroxylating ferredoxin subunit